MKFSRVIVVAVVLLFACSSNAQVGSDHSTDIVAKAVQVMGGDRYLQVRSQIGRGHYSILRDNALVSFQSFIDIIVYPDKERTEFKGGGSKTIQTYSGKTGWVYDGAQEILRNTNEKQEAEFKRGLRVSLDNLLRGYWKGQAQLSYVGKRQATLGKRNDVVRLTYDDGFAVEFEFADDGTPAKAVFKEVGSEGTEIAQEDRYAQFVDVDGVKAPFIIDRYNNGKQESRINYDSIEFNKTIPDSVFAKPANAKELKKDLKI